MDPRRFPDGPPPGLFDLPARQLLNELGGPTWLRVPGRGEHPARAVATLLHGDEPTGLRAVRRLLRRPLDLPFDLHVVLFNVEAALAGPGFASRYLDDQEDGNRIWGSTSGPPTGQRRAADAILGDLLADPLDALVDVHNTTGDNPYHAIVRDGDPAAIDLATRFTTTLLHWDLEAGTLLEALEGTCPAVAVECGLDGPASLRFAVDGLRRFLGPRPGDGEVIPDHDLVGRLLRVTVAEDAAIRFGGHLDAATDLVLPPEGDASNLTPVDPGHVLGLVHPDRPLPLRVTDADGTDRTAETLEIRADGAVITRGTQVPVMVVRSVEAVRKDCLCYLGATLSPLAT
jgi:hypothetical protein